MRRSRKKYILKGAVVLLIAAAMIFSTVAVTANTVNNQTQENMFSKSGVDYTPQPQTKMEETIPSTVGLRDIILFESFEDPWVADSDGDLAPPNWENHITDFTDTGSPSYLPHYWGQYGTVTTYTPPAVPPDGEYQAMVQWSYNHQDEWLITPLLDFSDCANCEVTFWRYGHIGSTYGDHYYVKASPTGGYNQADFTDILWDASALPEGDNNYDTPYTIDLSLYDGTSIRLAWHNEDPPTNDGLWWGSCIDAVEVTCECEEPCNPSIDVEKEVKDKNGTWQDADTANEAADVLICQNITYRITITNTGDCPLKDIRVLDTMHDSIRFISADPEGESWYEEPYYYIEWFFPGPLEVNGTIVITITAHVEGPECSIDPNHVNVTATCIHEKPVSDEDWCYVHCGEEARALDRPFLRFLQSYPNLFRLMEKLLQRLGLQ